MESKLAVNLRLWIDKDNQPFLGPGRVELLENISKYGSISKGASKVKMSYRKAWQLIQDMNGLASTPLVIKKVGGKLGGGAEVTKEGLKLIEQYRFLQARMDTEMNEYANEIRI